MNRKKVELQILNITNSQAQVGAYALVLGEVNGDRQMPIIIGAFEAQTLMIELRNIVPPRPLTHNLFASVLEILGVRLMRVLIYQVQNGVFYSYLYLKEDETIYRVDARTSDAVSLALRMNAPIYVYEDILEAEYIRREVYTDNADNEASDTEEETLDSLNAELQKAIENEEYEQAATIRDKINRLKQS